MRPIYLDYASTTPCDPAVIDAMQPFLYERFGNASSPHSYGRAARKALENSREQVAKHLGSTPQEIVFTSGASESNNHVIFGMALAKKGHIVCSAIEHHSVLEPVHRLEQQGYQVTYVKPNAEGVIEASTIEGLLTPSTILVCLQHANNEIGTLQPVQEIGLICRARNIPFLVDATQTVGHQPVDVNELQCDFLSMSAHKFYGPQGVGVVYIRKGCELPPLILGGDQERGRRAATVNLAGAVGLAAALEMAIKDMASASVRETQMRNRIIEGILSAIPGAQFNGSKTKRLANNAHFAFADTDGEELVASLDLKGICASMGSACTWGRLEPSHVLKALGLSDALALGALRISVGRWTTADDVEYFLKTLAALKS